MTSPGTDDWPDLVKPWLAEIVANPLDESEVAEFRSSSDHRHNPELALQVDRDGVPVWWPNRHPKTGERLSQERRRGFFLEWLSGVWNVHEKKIRLGSQAYRRRRLGIELICLQAEMPEAWEQMPWDERVAVVSREQALKVATKIAKTMQRTVREVLDVGDLTVQGIRPPCVYNLDLSDCWIAYLTPLGVALRASDIVVIDKTTGAVRYSGSARDEA